MIRFLPILLFICLFGICILLAKWLTRFLRKARPAETFSNADTDDILFYVDGENDESSEEDDDASDALDDEAYIKAIEFDDAPDSPQTGVIVVQYVPIRSSKQRESSPPRRSSRGRR